MKLNITTPVKPIPHRLTSCFEVVSIQSERESTMEIRGGFDDVRPIIDLLMSKGKKLSIFWYDIFGDKYNVEVQE